MGLFDEGYSTKALAIRMPMGGGALAPATDSAYILRMNAPKVKSGKTLNSDCFRR
jgi:hypothetical protein